MKVVLIASECVPYCKTGGLADVTRALFDELSAQGIDVHLMLPYYKGISARDISSTEVNFDISVGEGVYNVRVFKSGRVYFIYNKELFYRDGIYGYNGDYQDNDLRFAFFCKAALLALKRLSLNPDVLHLHDWQTAPVSVFLKNSFQNDKYYRKIRTVLTIHNLGYQGIFDRRALYLLDLDDSMFTPEYLEFYGKVNFLKGGILFSDVITTVSRKYAEEILSEEYGFGLHGVLRKRKKALYGIINGIDYSVWSPENDPFLYSSYSEENLKGKGLCKLALLKELGFSPGRNIPVFAFIGRLTTQKGLDLIEGALDMLVDKKCRVVILGEGDKEIESTLRNKFNRHREIIALKIGFNEPLAHLVYAGSDFTLMPSRYEPCGLVQLISLRYGTIPIARNTGGLADTIDDYDPETDEGTGFLFDEYNESAFREAIKRALILFYIKGRWRSMIKRAMRKRFSWQDSAKRYIEIYDNLVKHKV